MKAQIKIAELELFDCDTQYAIININGKDYMFDVDVDWDIEFIKDWCSTDRGDIDMSTFEITATGISLTQFQVGQDMDENNINFDIETAKQIAEIIKDKIEDVNEYGEYILRHEGHIDAY